MDESPLVPESPGELKETAERLALVAAGRLTAQPIKVKAMPLPPQHERQNAGNGCIAVRERQRLRESLLCPQTSRTSSRRARPLTR